MNPYTVRLLFDVPGWAYHRRCQALQKYAPDDFTVTIGPDYGRVLKALKHDLVLQLCYACSQNIRRHCERAGYNIVVVTGMNVAWESAKPWFKSCNKYSDWVLFNSCMTWEKAGELPRTSWISNGVDRDIFHPTNPPEKRKPKVLSIGSWFHRKNKGFADILPEVERRLKPHGIDCDFRCIDSHGRTRVSQEQLAAWYNTGTVYVVASEFEGTPNPALEAAACGCVLVSTRVGNMPELIEGGASGHLVSRDVESITAMIIDATEQRATMGAASLLAIESWSWETRSREYFALFRRLIDERRAS